MNLPNRLTLARIVFTALFVLCFSADFPFRFTSAFLLFALAALTDLLDGLIARRWNLITDFGKLMDPLADKILTASAFVCLIQFGAIPAWAVILVISREFLITGLRSLAATNGFVIPADNLGKHKTTWQMLTIIYFLLLLALGEVTRLSWFEAAWVVGTHGLVPLTVILSVYSGLAYFFKNRDLIKTA
ncbi:MAG: CDP-diacylglycerol--glycerol-3-phosphate 3-phosphatidyltransferase [bacterium]